MYESNLRFEGEHFGAMDFGAYGMGLGASITPVGSQLVNTNTAINWGLNNLELTFGTQMSFQQQGHLAQLGTMEREELIRLAKINQVNLSLHAPHFDAAGNVGNSFSEDARKMAVREFDQMVDFADQIGTRQNMKGVPIVIHGAEAARSSPDPTTMMYFTDRETGNMIPIGKRDVTYDREFLEQEHKLKAGIHFIDLNKKTKDGHEIFELLPAGEIEMHNRKRGEQLRSQLAHTYYWLDHHKQQEDQAIHYVQELQHKPDVTENQLKVAQENINRATLQRRTYEDEAKRFEQEVNHYERMYEKEGGQFVPSDRYAREKTIKTIVEVAKYAAAKNSEPHLVVENIFPEVVMGNPELLAKTVEDARKQFVAEVSKPKSEGGLGMHASEAQRKANDMIGINFDIGHANLWKKYGQMPEIDPNTGNYTGKMIKVDDNKIKEWASMLQKKGLLKHVHITDNLGDQDAHMPVGWGNAPINDIMDKLKKEGWGRKGERAIMETFGMVQYGGQGFGVPMSLYGMHMPLVSGGADWESAAGSYFGAGYPMTGFQTFPDINYQLYGVGFGGLPYATGGALPGSKGPGSQFSGAPMS